MWELPQVDRSMVRGVLNFAQGETQLFEKAKNTTCHNIVVIDVKSKQ